LGEIFRKVKGENSTSFINSFRIEKSEHLLVGSYEKILDIAMKVGYRDLSHFYTVFKEKENQTPKGLREKRQRTE